MPLNLKEMKPGMSLDNDVHVGVRKYKSLTHEMEPS